MDKIKRFFGNYNLTWKRLIIFSVIVAVYTATVLLLPVINKTAIKEIGVGFECWFLLAIFIVSNCKNYKEAAIKCFVFFLISQPLIFIIQSPFVHRNLLAEFYMPWLEKTFLTLPGGAIAYQIKRKDILGSIILACAGGFISAIGILYLNRGITYIIYCLFLLASTVLLGIIFCEEKKNKIVYYSVVTLIVLVICVFLRGYII